METLLKILETPIWTLLVLAGIIIVFFAFFELSKGTVKLRKKPKDGTVPAAIGAILIIGGLLLSNHQQAVPAEATPVNPAPATPVNIAFTEVPPVVPTATTEAPRATFTPTATDILPTLPASPEPTKTVADDCIDTRTWTPDSTDADALNALVAENNCWNLGPLGIAAQDGILRILRRSPKTQAASGIYTTIGNQSSIEFKVYVNSLYLVLDGNPAYITFSIAPKDNPLARQESGRFKLQVKDLGDSPFVLFMLADINESNGAEMGTQHYLYGRTYTIRFELKEIFMKLFINGVDTRRTISIPSGTNVFYIGYNLPMHAGADVEIKDLTIDGLKK